MVESIEAEDGGGSTSMRNRAASFRKKVRHLPELLRRGRILGRWIFVGLMLLAFFSMLPKFLLINSLPAGGMILPHKNEPKPQNNMVEDRNDPHASMQVIKILHKCLPCNTLNLVILYMSHEAIYHLVHGDVTLLYSMIFGFVCDSFIVLCLSNSV